MPRKLHRSALRKFAALAALLTVAAACADSAMMSRESPGDSAWAYVPCANVECQPGFYCDNDSCVPEAQPPPPPPPGETFSPLASGRYVFSLQKQSKQVVRIDSLTLELDSLRAGLAPMELGVVGSRELMVLLDAMDLVEVIDSRSAPPVRAVWESARGLSHLRLSPTGAHAVAYYDWDDGRSADRQPEPGNINQVSVILLADGSTPFADSDARVVDIAVGILPSDVRFAADGQRAVIVSSDSLTPVELLDGTAGIAQALPSLPIQEGAAQIFIDSGATLAALYYPDAMQIEVIDLSGAGGGGCFAATGSITDMVIDRDDNLIVDIAASRLAIAPIAAAAPSCVALNESLVFGPASRLAVDGSSSYAIAYEPDNAVETLWRIEIASDGNHSVSAVPLQKAVAAVAFMGDGLHALISHTKLPGTPAWNISVEAPGLSLDKSYGVSWLNLATLNTRLEYNVEPYGRFTFVPPYDDGTTVRPGMTYQALLDQSAPALVKVTHAPGFAVTPLLLAATPIELGYLPETARAYVTQEHPWGRITFIDPSSDELRHVTGFALQENL